MVKLYFLVLVKSFKRNWKIILPVFLILSGLIFLILKQTPSNWLSQGLIGTYQEHDLPETVTNLLSQSLVEPDKEGRMKAALASGWEVNNDATIFKFKLKDNLYWSDGTKLLSTDLEFAIPEVEVSFPDEKTIHFKLRSSFSPFPSLLTKPLLKKGTLIGVGPYKVIKIEKSRIFITKIILESKEGTLPDLNLRFYPNEKIALTAFELGEVQSLVGPSNLGSISDNPLATVTKLQNYNKLVSILYNTKDVELSNRSLRQALSYSAPTISDELEAKTPIPPLYWGFSEDVNDYLSNKEGAQAALKRAESNGSEAFLKSEIVLTSTPQLENVGKQVVEVWKSLGLNVVLRVEGGIPQNFQALLIAQTIPIDPDQYSLWHSTQTKTNMTKYSSARVDKDLEDGRRLLKEADRKLKYADFQKTLLEDSPATFLYFPKTNVIYLKKVSNQLNKILSIQLQ